MKILQNFTLFFLFSLCFNAFNIYSQTIHKGTNNDSISVFEQVSDKRNGEAGNMYDSNTKIEVRTFQTDSACWGYDIYLNDKIYIHQPHIPAINGIKGFKSESDARKTGYLVADKINRNIIPPAISIKELDSLGVLK